MVVPPVTIVHEALEPVSVDEEDTEVVTGAGSNSEEGVTVRVNGS